MPKLNRIRIANVSYDGKFITDETYNMYGGENTLFNLANGSGKSVLVQMMLQPILPLRRIHKRRVESYLSKPGSPTYVMLEWQLDNTLRPVYFMTGIVMCSIGQSDDTAARVKYFTFTHKYESATEYDIANTPLIEATNNSYTFMAYDDAFKLLKNVKSENTPLNCFTPDNKDAYRKHISEHGVFAEEWELLAKVNNREGGVDEVFADCKSSDTLLERWILRTISDNTGANENNLGDMFFSLISSVLSMEETLDQKDLLSAFLDEVDMLIRTLSMLLERLDCRGQVATLLSGLFCHLIKRCGEISNEKLFCEEKMDELDGERKYINYQKLSDFWHNANEKFLSSKDLLEQLTSDVNLKRDSYTDAKCYREIMEAANFFSRKQLAIESIAALVQQLQILKDGQGDQEAQDVLFSLDKKYAHNIEKSQESLQLLLSKTEDVKKEQEQYKNESMSINKKMQEISGELGRLNEKLEAYSHYEANCQKSLGISISRTLDFRLSDDEIKDAERHLEDEKLRFVQAEKDMISRLKEDMLRRDKLVENWRELTEELGDLVLRIGNQKKNIEEYEKASEDFMEITRRRGVSDSIAYMQESISTLREREVQQKKELYDLNVELVDYSAILARFKSGSLHFAPAFVKLLESNNISYITGENYLSEKTAGEQLEALERNPMLPFCVLVGKADFEKAVALRPEGIDRLCPILILENASNRFGVGNRSIELTEFGRIMCHYFEDSISPEKRDSFRNKLEESVASAKSKCNEWEHELAVLAEDIKFLESFPYDCDSERSLHVSYNELETKRQSTADKRDMDKLESEKLSESCDILKEEISRCRVQLEQADNNLVLFSEYIEKDADYVMNVDKQRQLINVKEGLINRSKGISEKLSSLDIKLEALVAETSKTNDSLEQMKKKHREITAPQSGQILDWPLDELISRYEEIRQKLTQDESLINHKISGLKKDRDEAEKSLKKFTHLDIQEIGNVAFEQNQLVALEKEEERAKKLLNDAEERQREAEKVFTSADTEKNMRQKQLEEEGYDEPLSIGEIIRDFDTRFARIDKQQKELKAKIDAFDEENSKHQQITSRIISIIGQPENIDIESPEDGWDTVDVDKQSEIFSETNNEISRLGRESIIKENDIRLKYQHRHPGIDNMIKSLNIDECTNDYETCYFVFERLNQQRDLVLEHVRILESHLENLDKQKEHVIFHAFEQGKKIHTELLRISKSSRVKLDPSKPAQQTVKIGIPDELDHFAGERIREYVSNCVNEMRKSKKEGEFSEKLLRSFIESRLSDREILNQVIGQHKISVSLLKVDTFQANSRLRTWESVLTDNSGGELFVSCFALLSSLMNYSRSSSFFDDMPKGGTKVMLIDNPFGKTSSPHLLDALIRVAEQFDMQMICLSDLSQSSITAKFSLIYQLSLRPTVSGNKSYLKTDKLLSNVPLNHDSRLEHISLRNEQIGLF